MNPALADLAVSMQRLATQYIPRAYALGRDKILKRYGQILAWGERDNANLEILLSRHAKELQRAMAALELKIGQGATVEQAVGLINENLWTWALSPATAVGIAAGVDASRAIIARAENLDPSDIGVIWLTAEDAKVCKKCLYLAGRWFNAKDAYEIAATIHPHCRCPAHFDVGVPSEALVGPLPNYRAGTSEQVFENLGSVIDQAIAARNRTANQYRQGSPSGYARPNVNI